MNGNTGALQIANAVFHTASRRLIRGEYVFDLEPKVADLLGMLISADGVLTRESILNALWGITGSDEALTQTASKLRRALGDTVRPYRIVETVPRVGYKLMAPVTLAKVQNGKASHSTKIFQSSILKPIEKSVDFYRGAIIGAAIMGFTIYGYFSLHDPKNIEVEIDCPSHFSSDECIRLVAGTRQ